MTDRTLDQIDIEILTALQNEARISNKELAAHIGLAPSSCLERVRRLEEEGRILGYHARVDESALGVGIQALVLVGLERHSRELVDAFRAHLQTLPQVVATYHLAGRHDFLLHVVARDPDHLRDLALDAFTTRPEVGHIETLLIYEHRRRGALPSYVAVDQ